MKSTVDIKDEKTQSAPLEQQCRCFTMSELISATDNFDEKWCIGHGGFGKVYKGKKIDGPVNTYAIKRLNFMSDQGEPEFWAEIDMLSRLRHCNLVSLIGYCDEEQEMALVYEYMHNGTLYDHLHKKGTHLTWSQRLKICIGAARGLDYLHTGTGTQQGVIHRDVKSSNILLDGNYAAKISDFGLAKIGPTNQTRTYVSTIVKGTFGYMDPTYFYTGRVTRKSDVYAFGVVLLEVLCGRPALDESLDEGLAMWAQDQIKQGKISQIIDSRLQDYISMRSLKEFSRTAVRCLNSNPNLRPTMSEVVSSLEWALSFQEKNASTQRVINIKNVWSLLLHKRHFEFRSLWATGSSDRLPALEGLQIVGDAFPGGELQVCGYSINGADICMFQWVQCAPDGSTRIYKSTTPNITVSLDDVGTCLHVEVIPVDKKGRKGRLYKCLANDGFPINPINAIDPIDEAVTGPVSDNETEAEAEVIRIVPLKGEDDSNNPPPSIKSLQITGNAYPGGTVEMRGFSINGTVSCFLHWFHQLQDGSIDYIKGATVETYTVAASDIGTYLGIEVIPVDKNGRKGISYKCFANNESLITDSIEFLDDYNVENLNS